MPKKINISSDANSVVLDTEPFLLSKGILGLVKRIL